MTLLPGYSARGLRVSPLQGHRPCHVLEALRPPVKQRSRASPSPSSVARASRGPMRLCSSPRGKQPPCPMVRRCRPPTRPLRRVPAAAHAHEQTRGAACVDKRPSGNAWGGSGAFAARSDVPSARPPPSPSRGRSRRWVAHFRSEYRAPAGVALGAGVAAARDTRDLGGLEARGRAGRRRPGRTGAVRRRRGGPAVPGGLWDRGAQARQRSSAPLPFPPTRAARWALVGGSVTSGDWPGARGGRAPRDSPAARSPGSRRSSCRVRFPQAACLSFRDHQVRPSGRLRAV